MIIEACPNLSNPEVAREFNEIKEATSEKTAYNIWSLNNGYGIDKAPNGAESVLFNSLLIECNGDRRAAIRAKAALYGNNFRKWFGDWLLEDKANVSKVVDENGEPLMVYHGGLLAKQIKRFDKSKLGTTTGSRSAKLGFFFASNRTNSAKYAKLREIIFNGVRYDVGENSNASVIYDAYEKAKRGIPDYDRVRFIEDPLYIPNEGDDYEPEPEYAPAYQDELYNLIDKMGYLKLLLSEAESDQETDSIVKQLELAEKEYDKLAELADKEAEFIKQEEAKSADDAKKLIPIFEKALKEALSDEFLTYGYDYIHILEPGEEPKLYYYQERSKVHAVFLNIKDIDVRDDKGKKFSDGSYTGQFKKALARGKNGAVRKNTRDPLFTDVYIVFEPNQIKSAIDNREIEQPGTGFSTTDDNIYNHLLRTPFLQHYLDEAKKILNNADTNTKKNIHALNELMKRKFGSIQVGKKNKALFPFATNAYEFKENETSKIFEEFIDLEKPASSEELDALSNLFASKLRNEVRFVSTLAVKEGSAKSEVRDGIVYVYLPMSGNASYTTLAEELLHPITATLQNQSPQLFEQFLRECMESNDKRIRLIVSTVLLLYDNKPKSEQDNEIVTLCLAYLLKNANDEKASVLTRVIQWICNLLNKSGLANIKPGAFSLERFAYALKFGALELSVLDTNTVYDHISPGTQSYEDEAAEFLASSPAIQIAFEAQRENYIRSQNPQTEDERNQLAREFDLTQMKLNTLRVTEAIAKEYDLSVSSLVVVTGPIIHANVAYTYTANDEKGKYVAMLLNSMNKRLSDPKFASTEARFLLDTVIGTNDISLIIMQMSRVYIEDFYEADAILEVMAMVDPTGKMHKDDLIDTLTDMVIKAVIDPKSTEVSTVAKINNTILNFVRKRFNQNTISEQAKRMLISVIAENMSCYEDLQRINTEDLLHDVKWYEITGKESQVTPKNIVDAIKKGVKILIKSQLSVTNVDSEKLLILNLMLAKLEAIDFDNNPDDVLGVVSDFIVDGMLDINKANATLHSMLTIDPANIDSKQLYSIRTDVIGYYRSIINNYIIPFTRNTTNPTLLPGGALYSTIRSMLDKCTHTQQLYDYVLRVYVEKLIDNFVDSNVNIGDKERFKVNCKLWLHNKVNNGDLGFFENWIKSAVSSHSPIVRMVDDFVREYETDVRKQALKKAKQLQNTYRKCEPSLAKLSPFNYQRNFCELDDDGQTTGNFISEVNVGQFDKEKKQFIDWWIENRGVIRNEDGVLEFPDDETWKEFNDAYDDFLDGRQHRRYTAGYYKLERLFLSRDTIEYRRNIRKRIQLLYDKCYDKDIDGPNIWSLNREDYLSLLDLLKLQQNLANPYIITYDADGKISKIEEKVGDAARMAREISEFNKMINGNIKFTPNYDKYNSAKKAIELKFGKNSNEYKAFVYNFSTRAVKQKYYERLELIFGPKSSLIFPALDRINNKIKAIINATISKRGKYVLDLSKMSDDAYAELKKLEEEKINLLRTLKTKSGKKLTQEEWDEINGMHHYEYVVNPATGIPVIKLLEQEYDQKGKHQEFLNKFFVVSDDSAHPLSIFLYDKIEPEYIDEEQPIGMFSDIDESSYYVDPLYDPEDKEFMNVDKRRYHNDKFDELKKDSNAYKFYTEMLKMMDEAWSMLPDINRHYKYMLPQRRGSISLLVARDIVNAFTGKQGIQKISFKQVSKNIIKLVIAGMLGGLALGGLAALSPWITTSAALITGAGYGTITGFIAGLLTRDKNIADQLLSITENDVQFNESFAVRPDGTEVETIPIRFVRRLDDPTSVSTDLINSVSTFYEMALNYKQKEKLAPIVENILFELSGGFNGSSVTDLADRVRSYKSAMIYGRKKTGLARRSSNKMTQSEQKISKLVSFILNTTHAKMLPWNGTSIYKNMIDSTLSLISLLTSMKQLTPQDLGRGIIDMGKEIFNGTAFTNIGSPNTSSFTGAAMQYNGVHMNIGGTFGDTLKYWIRRCLERFMSMGPFTLIDYTFKGLFTNMVYNTYRLVMNPSTGKMEFMNKQEAQFAYASENGGRKEGLKRWKKATTKLRHAYVVTEDGLQLKDEYKELVGKKLETRVSGLIREQSAVVNGMLDEQDINKVSQNFIGSMILLMRGWMVSQLIDYNKDGQDFAVFATNTEDINTKLFGSNNLGSLQSKFIGSLDAFVSQQAPSDQEGQYNFATGFIERGWWVGWNKLVKNALSIRRLTPHNKYQLRYLAMILLTTISLGLATHPLYKWRESSDELYKETDPYNVERVASNFLYTGTVAAYSERFGQIGPLGFGNSLLELVNSPTVASSYIKDLNSIIDVSEDIFKLTDELWHGYGIDQTEPMQIVKRGSFKGRTKLTKDLLKASTEMPVINELGIANMYKTVSPDAQKEKLKFYKKTIPFTGIQPWLKLPETGLLKTTTSKAVKPIKKYR